MYYSTLSKAAPFGGVLVLYHSRRWSFVAGGTRQIYQEWDKGLENIVGGGGPCPSTALDPLRLFHDNRKKVDRYGYYSGLLW